MANELKLSFNVTFDDGIKPEVVASITERFKTIADKRPVMLVQSVGTSEEAVVLGDTAALGGTLVLVNLDPTNFVNVKVATGGAIFAKLFPDTDSDGSGGFIVLDAMGSGALAPFVIADTAACKVLVMICPP